MNQWRTLSDGRVEVDQGRGFAVPGLTSIEAQLFERSVVRWRDLAAEHGRRHGVPVPWILGVILAESGGNAKAGPNTKGFGGLMAIGPGTVRAVEPNRRAGWNMHDPDFNAHIGVSFLAKLRALAGERGADLPTVASMYNAGQLADGRPHSSQRSPWGMRENEGYISRVVRAANHAAGARSSSTAGGPIAEGAASALGLLALAWVAWKVLT